MSLRIPWDRYEVAVLIDASIKVINNEITKKDAVKNVSLRLRKKAVNSGIIIDNVYRNENGISMQMNIIIAMLLNKKSGLHNASKLFNDVVTIYETDKECFYTLLKEASIMIDPPADESEKSSLLFTDEQSHRDIPDCTKNVMHPEKKNISEIDLIITEIMNSHYQYGFKIDSIRELMRFRQFAEALSATLPDNDDELISAIKASGTIIDGKVFCKSESLPDELNKIVSMILSDSVNVIYYSKLFEMHNEWMSTHVITSSEILKEYLQKHITNCHFSKTFMIQGSKQTEKNAVTNELIRVWGDYQVRTVDSLSDDLPYIPIGNIWRVISGNDYFVLADEGSYLYTEKIKVTDNEASDILDYVQSTIISSGFASLNDLPLGDIEEENYEIPRIPLLNGLYKRFLSDEYKLNGTIITKDSSNLDAVSLLKKHLKDAEQCTFEELDSELMRLTGRINRQYTFQALYDEMIRVDKERFVANHKIRFHVSEIDSVISDFITDGFVSLKEITTFAMFPVCGSTWNHFVLESYCYKYSQKYSLHTIHFNDKNVGIIAEKDYDRKYDDMLAIALARSDIDLDSGSAGQYLFDNGYLAKTKYAALGRITEQAKQIRKER